MAKLKKPVVKSFDGLVQSLKESSLKHNQETRVSVYLFDDTVKVLIFDMDVMRVPSLEGYYDVQGWTALATAMNHAMDDLEKVPALYTDHAFLVYVLTDGDDNRSGFNQIERLANRVSTLAENWTVVAHVPNKQGMGYMKRLGFHLGNIEVWDVSEKGLDKAVTSFSESSDRYMSMRSTGVRGSSSYFQIKAGNLNDGAVKSNLKALNLNNHTVLVNPNPKSIWISELVEKSTGKPYVKGSAYYHFTKTESIRPGVDILIREKANGRIYCGREKVRKILGLNIDGTVKVKPELVPDYEIYIQSERYNRNIVPGQHVIVLH